MTAHRRRIAVIGHRLAAEAPTGVGRYYAELVRGLASLTGDDTTLVAASTREPRRVDWLPPGVERRTIRGPRKLVTLGWSLLGGPSIDADLGHPDLVHAMHAWAPTPTRAPLVVTIHDVMPLRHPHWYGRTEAWSFRRGLDHARERAGAVLTDSATEAAELVSRAGFDRARIRVVPLGVDDAFRAARRPAADNAVCARHGVEPGRYVIAVGAVSERKNLTVVLDALHRMDPAILGTPALLVVGPRWAGSDAVEAAVEARGLRDHVRFAGYVPTADLPALMGAALALVHPSRDEGFGLTPLEAMAAGTAAVVSASGSLAEVAGPGAVTAGAADPDEWASAITDLATDPDHRARVLAAGRAHQASFTWARTAAATLAVYEEFLGARV